ncbi:YihY/virulence factor BrkB family protein [Aquipuribacter hungaricus]|uniref:YihY/virulence factor BrkB family protein n=1 Tax=Aquipuribacter hungaricus TaxID=545624 RepID=A0ABV7WGV1_9MICO
MSSRGTTTSEQAGTGDGALPGAQATKPTEIPASGWKQVLKRAWKEAKADNVPMLAGGVAFFAFLALFPAMIALISLWGLVVGGPDAARQAEELTAGLPQEASSIIAEQMKAVGSQDSGLGIGFVISILLALWSASGGTANLIKAVNIAYDEDETRGFVKLRGLALLLTLGAIVFVILSVGLVAVVPPVLDNLGLGIAGTIAAQAARWVLLVVLVAVALAVVYRLAPDRDDPKLRWVSQGAAVATVLWLLGSIAFSLYVSNFGSYNETYGAIAGVAVLLLWLYLTTYIILLGAEINAETERQTLKDTTTGPEQPMGSRGAEAADSKASATETAKGRRR